MTTQTKKSAYPAKDWGMAKIARHASVSEVDTGESGGAPDYKFDVLLKDGWRFTEGRNAGGRSLLCNSVADFEAAKPRKISE